MTSLQNIVIMGAQGLLRPHDVDGIKDKDDQAANIILFS